MSQFENDETLDETTTEVVEETAEVEAVENDAENDAEAEASARQIFHKEIVTVNIREIAQQGGCLNCISWEEPHAQ